MNASASTGTVRTSRQARETRVLDTAARLFYARGVHEVGMDELVRSTGLGKATIYRLYPTKDALIGAYLQRLAATIAASIDDQVAAHPADPRGALLAVLGDIKDDLRRPDFRGCAFNNASIEYDDPTHPARIQARDHRALLWRRLTELAEQLVPGRGAALGGQLAALIDGCYTSAAHLGPDGPAASGLALALTLVRDA
ncbi:MAG TPA: TetR/AcrR family transcriptional regulator [Acidimicrobiales bacterium]